MKRQINTVVFDVGNVLIEWDPRHLYKQLIEDDAQIDHFLTNVCSTEWNLEQDRGRSWSEAVAERIKVFPEHEALIRAYDERWSDMVPGEISGSVQILEELQAAGTPLYAITNFSAEKFKLAQKRFPFLKTPFRDIVVSGDEQLLKPEPEIYQVLFERNNLDPSQTVFIDDSRPNVETARSLGMAAIHFQSPHALRTELKELGFDV